jgi:hypothetical protein
MNNHEYSDIFALFQGVEKLEYRNKKKDLSELNDEKKSSAMGLNKNDNRTSNNRIKVIGRVKRAAII